MHCGNRIAALKEYVRRVTRITTMLDESGISVRFINFAGDESLNAIRTVDEVERIMSRVNFCGGTCIGTNLQSKVLEPLLFARTRSHSLRKPLLITTITDGAVRIGENLVCGCVADWWFVIAGGGVSRALQECHLAMQADAAGS